MATFRRVCLWLHRELGFLAVGLTLVYAISGLAVNHAHHWDANYQRTLTVERMEPVGVHPTDEIRALVIERLGLGDEVKNTWRADSTTLQVFVEGGGYDVDLASGEITQHGFRKRPLLFDLNFMHLNLGKAPWTGIADVYAGILIILALTGPWLVRGRKGLKGRGGLLMALGIVLPLVYTLVVLA